MRFLRRNSTTATDDPETEGPDGGEEVEPQTRGYTPGKGRATPKRREAEAKRRGPVAPPPRTTREALKRNKELRKANPVSKEDRRAAAKERRERMAAGDDRYLLPRDRGPVKAYVRDVVDSRRHLVGLFMPLAVLVFAGMLMPPGIQQIATLAFMLLLILMIVEGILTGRRVSKQTRAKFPNETIKGMSIGWYAFIRASQIRKLRMPKPRIQIGDPVS
ncbi:DUF3043 domain-containing protein [Amycolatopsis sp. CA-230715]|uniref:DUF3043 domain-containing protein n=1 Tax=Amycolatopsis sp. CA-230715 TaxID=2745196 RepID=UPI001C011F3F|nr:DUF3043 domain-containing protein [Amycolatopsis sp. CA-230715]